VVKSVGADQGLHGNPARSARKGFIVLRGSFVVKEENPTVFSGMETQLTPLTHHQPDGRSPALEKGG